MSSQIQFWVYGGEGKELLFKMTDVNTFEGVYRAWTNRYGSDFYHFTYNSQLILERQTPRDIGLKNNDIVMCSRQHVQNERG